jgi:hypothetical protein
VLSGLWADVHDGRLHVDFELRSDHLPRGTRHSLSIYEQHPGRRQSSGPEGSISIRMCSTAATSRHPASRSTRRTVREPGSAANR